jgi:hypothetical protein
MPERLHAGDWTTARIWADRRSVERSEPVPTIPSSSRTMVAEESVIDLLAGLRPRPGRRSIDRDRHSACRLLLPVAEAG